MVPPFDCLPGQALRTGFAGREFGYAGNNGPNNGSGQVLHDASIADRRHYAGTTPGTFRGGRTSARSAMTAPPMSIIPPGLRLHILRLSYRMYYGQNRKRIFELGGDAMSVLGAIIGGGASQRFGGDKSIAQVNGQTLIEGVWNALEGQTDEVVICGRSWSTLKSLDDRPSRGMGPLGGINAALHYAAENGFDGVLCMPVDVHPAPENLASALVGSKLTVLRKQHLIGFWSSELAAALEAYLLTGQRKVSGFLDQMNARRVADPPGLINVNWPDDLEKLKRQ